jgi:outer membrane protein assembly factor BamB
MRVQPTTLILITTATFLWAGTAYAKRADPKPVPPVVWQGVEYRAPLDVEKIGHVQAFDQVSGLKLWETTAYTITINPFVEQDVQWVFISEMHVQDGKLVITNEDGKTYRLDLKTGRVESATLYRMAIFLAAVVLIFGVFAVWRQAELRQRKSIG